MSSQPIRIAVEVLYASAAPGGGVLMPGRREVERSFAEALIASGHARPVEEQEAKRG